MFNPPRNLLSALLFAPALSLAAGSAIITLEMPVGARQLGMGEVGAALADDATAMYYNPAGLAFGPLADEWKVSFPADAKTTPHFTNMASRAKNGFFCMAYILKEDGYKIGIMSSVPINHATPASFYAHSNDRGDYYNISVQIPSTGFDFFGGPGTKWWHC